MLTNGGEKFAGSEEPIVPLSIIFFVILRRSNLRA